VNSADPELRSDGTTLNINTGGTLGSAAFTNSSAYAARTNTAWPPVATDPATTQALANSIAPPAVGRHRHLMTTTKHFSTTKEGTMSIQNYIHDGSILAAAAAVQGVAVPALTKRIMRAATICNTTAAAVAASVWLVPPAAIRMRPMR
jgi:hypothetical protein